MTETTPSGCPDVFTVDLTCLFLEIQRLREGAGHDYPHDVVPEIIEQVYHLTDTPPAASSSSGTTPATARRPTSRLR